MIGEALSQTGHDLLVGFAVLLAVSLLVTASWCAMWWFRERNIRRHKLDVTSEAIRDLEAAKEALRVIGGGRRGPEPIDNHGRKRVGL
jgi:hypothetical protein